jgi:hypothetical protein
MSEYQYYEFVAVDRPLTGKQQAELRAVSTRGDVSPTGFVNEYQWGDLKADPRMWMERYFDAHLYLANWGTHRIALRLPRAVLDPATAARYCVGPAAESWSTRTHVIVDLNSQDEDGVEDWVEPGGRLAAIAQARAEMAEGDLRPLYLAWLLVLQDRELDEDELEPPVPAGLGELSGPQRALAEFLRVDPDLLAAAAEASEPLTAKAPSAAVLGRWVRALPAADKDELLLRVLRGDGAVLRSEMLRRFHGTEAGQPADGGRTVGELLAAGQRVWDRRQQATRKRESAERRRKEREAAAARSERLDELARDPAKAWEQVATSIEAKRPKDYDVAVVLLEDLHALAVRDGELAQFADRVGRLREQYARRLALIDRFDRAQLP